MLYHHHRVLPLHSNHIVDHFTMKKTFRTLLRRGRRSNEPPSAPTAPLSMPSTAHQSTHPVTPNTTAIPNNPQPVSPAMAFTDARYVDASHSVFNQAGRDIINYQLVNRTCFVIVDLKPRTYVPLLRTGNDLPNPDGQFYFLHVLTFD